MKNIKSYKLFEKHTNHKEFFYDMDDIFIELSDSGFIGNKDIYVSGNWYSYSIKGESVIIKPPFGEESELPHFSNIEGMLFEKITINERNIEHVIETLLRAYRYSKSNDWVVNIYYYTPSSHFSNKDIIDESEALSESDIENRLYNIKLPNQLTFNTYTI